MKKNLFSRLLATSLTLALLLPCLMLAPVKADDAGVMEIWHWEFGTSTKESNIQAHMATFNANVINETSKRSNGYGVNSGTMYGVDGPFKNYSFFMRTNAGVSSGQHYGLPYSTTGKWTKVAENLEYSLGDLGSVYTRGLEAINVDFTFTFFETQGNGVIPFARDLEVYIAVNGGDYLPDSVGVRSSKLLAGGNVHSTSTGLVFEVQSENLFDIEGFEPGMTITGIKVRPDGDGPRGSLHMVNDITVNGYETQEAWETHVPAENRPTVTIDPAILRQIAVDEGIRTATIPWTTDTIIDVVNPSGSSAANTGETKNRQYVPGIEYHGPVYGRIIDATREQLFASIVDGKYGVGDGGYPTDLVVAMDCQTFGFNMISRVSRAGATSCENAFRAPGTSLLGNLKTSDFLPAFTDAHIIDLNEAQAVYEAYALAGPGDILDTYRSNDNNSLHVRPIRDVVVVRNADGTIDPEKSYMVCVESMGSLKYDIQLANGKVETVLAEAATTLYNYLEANPGSKVLFGRSAYPDTQYTFANLRDNKYVAITLDEYKDGVVELADVEMVIAPKSADGIIWKSGVNIAIASNYRIVARTIKLEDRATGDVLFLDDAILSAATGTGTYSSIMLNYNDAGLNTRLRTLHNGDYRLTVSVHSGPLTAIGQTQVPITTETVDFTVTGKAPLGSVTLSAPTAVAKGESVQVAVQAGTPCDGADVEVKFDTEVLSYVDGSLTPANAFGQITADKGIISIMAVDAGIAEAGQLAVLNFTAKSDIADLSKALQLKSAHLITAAEANSGVADKAMDATEVCASVNFADVSANAWYHDAVDYALNNQIMGGYNATTFGPNDKLSRAMVVQVLYNKEGQPTITGTHKFPDVKSGDWFNNAVTWANLNKVVGGYGDGTFQPNKNVSLQEVAVILWNYSGNPDPTGDASSLGAHDDWAANALSWAAANGIFDNVPYEVVTGTATRAQTAQMLMNFLSK